VPPIYHITPVNNLPSIVKAGGLLCDRNAKNIQFVSIAHQNIKARRLKRQVPVGPGGVLADYVPFYFAPRSPMLFTIHRGNVQGYTAGQGPIIHLVSSTEAVGGAGLDWVFTEGHAVIDYTDFFDDFADLNQIDWPLMRSRYWADTNDDPDRLRRRQAEFLVHQFFPWNLFSEIGVCNAKTEQQVKQILVGAQIPVSVKEAWYY
jgi:ssDNA thymidine ADP-ribosyltransferase, DarT